MDVEIEMLERIGPDVFHRLTFHGHACTEEELSSDGREIATGKFYSISEEFESNFLSMRNYMKCFDSSELKIYGTHNSVNNQYLRISFIIPEEACINSPDDSLECVTS